MTDHFHILPRPQGWTQMPRHHSRGGVGWGGAGRAGRFCFFLLQAHPPHPSFLKTKRARAFCLALCVPYPRPSLGWLFFLPSHPTSSCSVLLSLLASAPSILHLTLSTPGCESFWGLLSSL